MMRKLFTLGLMTLFLLGMGEVVGQVTLSKWALTANGNPNSVAANVSAGNFTGGSGVSVSYGSTGAFASGWSTGTLDNADYFQVTISPNPGYNITVNQVLFGERRSNTGIRDYQVRWSKSSSFTSPTTIATVNVPDVDTERTGDITGLSIDVADGETLYVRFFGYNAEAAGGTWRINDATLELKGVLTAGTCSISNLDVSNASFCNNNGTPSDPSDDYYEADVVVTYVDAPGTGTLNLSGAGVLGGTTSAAISTSPQTISGVHLRANNSDVAVAATFSSAPGCTYSETVAGTAVESCSNLPTVGFDVATSSVTEGNSGTAIHSVSITFSSAPSSNATLDIVTSAGTATENVDYDELATSLTFTTAESYPSTKMVDITINGDTNIESNETFQVFFVLATGSETLATVLTDVHTVTILDNDIPTAANIRINEVDSDTPGTDADEFIELYSEGTANFPLDGLVLVLFNGGNDQSYMAFDLDGYQTDGTGYFIIGSIAGAEINVAPGASGWLQNGADAVALYYASASNFPNGTAPTTTNLIDALVYDTDDTDDAGLLTGLGQSEQINENINSLATTQSIQRGSWFVAIPTPRAVNLPVSLIKFSATQVAATAVLTWATATEQNNSHFLIQRSVDGGRKFETIGQVAGRGDSNERVDYTYVDEKPATGTNYYRLHQFDYDGTNEFFGPVSVVFAGKGDAVRVWPTLAENELTIETTTDSDDAVLLSVYDLNGRLMLEQIASEKALQTTMSVAHLPAGAYFIRWQQGSAGGQVRFVKL